MSKRLKKRKDIMISCNQNGVITQMRLILILAVGL